MHISSKITLRTALKRHLLTDPRLTGRNLTALDVGGADINGSYRPLLEALEIEYTACDISDSDNVDVVQTQPEHLPFEDESFDIVVCGQTFEHAPHFDRLFSEMVRVTTLDGVIIVIAPSRGAEHRFPVDCYRFLPDSMASLAHDNHVHLIETRTSEFGPFHDLIGIFRRTLPVEPISPTPERWSALDDRPQNNDTRNEDPEAERLGGSRPALEFLRHVHSLLRPRGYLEIGVHQGNSLRLASCPAWGIDPVNLVTGELRTNHELVLSTSEDFFEFGTDLIDSPIDLAYIDGLHLLENAYFDFLKTEGLCHPGGVILVDDIFPNHPIQARRNRSSRAWVGDVWKLVGILREQRPELITIPVDTYPSGTLVIIGLDPENTRLADVFDLVLAGETVELGPPPKSVITRDGSWHPEDRLLQRIFRHIADSRDIGQQPDLELIRQLIADGTPRQLVDLR